jgi:hypothetical protein
MAQNLLIEYLPRSKSWNWRHGLQKYFSLVRVVLEKVIPLRLADLKPELYESIII